MTMICLWMAVLLLVATVVSQGSASESHTKRDLPMFRMGRRSLEERAAGPRMGRESEEGSDDDYKQLLNKLQLLYPVDLDPDTNEENKEESDRAIPYPRVGRALNMFRMGKRALHMVRMGRGNEKRALNMVRMGRALSMMRMGRSSYTPEEEAGTDKRALQMVRMGRNYETNKRALKMFRMGKRSEQKAE